MRLYLIIGAVVACVVSIVVAGDWMYDAGATSERLVCQSNESERLRTALAEVSRMQKQVRDDDTKHAKDLAKVSTDYQEQLLNEKTINARRVADIRNGTLKLRQPPSIKPNGDSGVTPPGAGTARCDGEAEGEFSIETSERLYGYAEEADEVVLQLTACQAVIDADRRIEGGVDE